MERIQPSGRGRAQSAQETVLVLLDFKIINAATAVHAGIGAGAMSHTRNIRMVLNYNGNGEIVDLGGLKPTSLQASGRKTSSHKLRAQAWSLSQQAPGSWPQGTSVQAGPGHKQQG